MYYSNFYYFNLLTVSFRWNHVNNEKKHPKMSVIFQIGISGMFRLCDTLAPKSVLKEKLGYCPWLPLAFTLFISTFYVKNCRYSSRFPAADAPVFSNDILYPSFFCWSAFVFPKERFLWYFTRNNWTSFFWQALTELKCPVVRFLPPSFVGDVQHFFGNATLPVFRQWSVKSSTFLLLMTKIIALRLYFLFVLLCLFNSD